MVDVFTRLARALKDGGILYASFKYGDFEGERNGRYFTDYTEARFAKLLEHFPELKWIEQGITIDKRPDREEKWLNVIVRKD
ncbi:MAG: SAM-dependent methyltransferase, partial [Niameybacter sp.]